MSEKPPFDAADDLQCTIPLFPLGSVLFPAGRIALRIFEPRYVDMTKACIRDNSPFGVVLIRAGFEAGTPAIPFDIGCTARISEWEVPSPGLFRLEARGENRFRVNRRWTLDDGLMMGEVTLLEPPDPLPLPEGHQPLAGMLQQAIDKLPDGALPSPYRLDDAAWVANRVLELLPVAPERKQALLEAADQPFAVLDGVAELLASLRGDSE